MRFVPVKSELQSDLQSLHRARERLIAERTALINNLRAVLFERGIIVARGRRKLEKALPGILADAASSMSPRIRQLISDLREEWHTLDGRITSFDAELVSLARTDEAARRLATVPGIGTINATALVAAVGDGNLRTRPGYGGLAGIGAASSNDRRQTTVAGHQQTRQPISAQEPDPRCPRGTAVSHPMRHAAR
jgi:transposase